MQVKNHQASKFSSIPSPLSRRASKHRRVELDAFARAGIVVICAVSFICLGDQTSIVHGQDSDSEVTKPSALDKLKSVYSEAHAAKTHESLDQVIQACQDLQQGEQAEQLTAKQQEQLAKLLSWACERRGNLFLDEANDAFHRQQQVTVLETDEQPEELDLKNEDQASSEEPIADSKSSESPANKPTTSVSTEPANSAVAPLQDDTRPIEEPLDGGLSFSAPNRSQESSQPSTTKEQLKTRVSPPEQGAMAPRPSPASPSDEPNSLANHAALADDAATTSTAMSPETSSEPSPYFEPAEITSDEASPSELIEFAVADFDLAISQDKTNWQAYHGLGVAKAMQGEFQAAVDSFKSSHELNPKHSSSLFNQAECLHALGEFEQAVACYSKLIQANPQDVSYYNGRGQSLVALNRLQESLADFKICAQLNPQSARAILNRGQIYQQLGKWEEAILDYGRARNLAPKMYEPTQRLAWLMATCPDPVFRNEAAAYELSMLSIRLKEELNAECLDTLAAAQAANGWFDDAVQTLDQAEELYPESITEQAKRRKTKYEARKPFHEQASRYR